MEESKYQPHDEVILDSGEEVSKVEECEYKELTRDQEEYLVDLLHERKNEPSDKPFGVYLVKSDNKCAQLGREIEVDVFGKFFQFDERLMQEEYGSYEQHSQFILVIDEKEKKPAGVMRLISNSEKGLKSLNDITIDPWNVPLERIFSENDIKSENLDSTWDIATLAVSKEYRGNLLVSSALYHALELTIERSGKDWLVTILDDKVLRLLEALGITFKRYKGVRSASYTGSPASTPVYTTIQDMRETAQKTNPSSYDYLFLGRGIDKNIDFSGLE